MCGQVHLDLLNIVHWYYSHCYWWATVLAVRPHDALHGITKMALFGFIEYLLNGSRGVCRALAADNTGLSGSIPSTVGQCTALT